ncbi:hypothetical protein [Bifidobacterium pseudolongum]|jgi:hypothetical protein|uniref:hypothetical protein n=1 Tax=Bifidobacterium pseudolongum TaxID=1694 RepID=UPI00102014F2|nr:hypothetical protein [Bifidobacterium pseudolongum]MCH4860934.1 hypothetical protein [Bifidobacterium pseudolongum]MCH4862706.1 hypothetical protein [Bifidobacterium pseudolongum]RYQ41883.1 hypothetical protein PG1791B_1660 [Bifidobacterium pseudolongum subsp. globosum]
MINVSQQRALLHGIIAECDRLAQERTSRAEQVMGIGHANADPYTDGYLDALTAVDAYCTRLDNGMWKP